MPGFLLFYAADMLILIILYDFCLLPEQFCYTIVYIGNVKPACTESETYVTTDGQSASPSWNKAPIWGLRPDSYYCLTVAGLLIWGILSDDRTGLSFAIAAGPRQRSHSLVRVPWDSKSKSKSKSHCD
jgi:hypothetical protein